MNKLRAVIAKEKRRRTNTVVAAVRQKQLALEHCNKIIASDQPNMALAIGLLPIAAKIAIKGAKFNFKVLKALTKASAWILFGYRKKPDERNRDKLIKTAALAYRMAANGLTKLQQQIRDAGQDAKQVAQKLMPQRKQLQKVKAEQYQRVHSLIDKKRDPAEYSKTRKIMGLT